LKGGCTVSVAASANEEIFIRLGLVDETRSGKKCSKNAKETSLFPTAIRRVNDDGNPEHRSKGTTTAHGQRTGVVFSIALELCENVVADSKEQTEENT
jgi:hypothetical protein